MTLFEQIQIFDSNWSLKSFILGRDLLLCESLHSFSFICVASPIVFTAVVGCASKNSWGCASSRKPNLTRSPRHYRPFHPKTIILNPSPSLWKWRCAVLPLILIFVLSMQARAMRLLSFISWRECTRWRISWLLSWNEMNVCRLRGRRSSDGTNLNSKRWD